MERIDKWFTGLNKIFISAATIVMFALVFLNVVARYIFSVSWAEFEEITIFLMIFITWFGMGVALREGRLVAFDILQDALPPKALMLLRTAIGLLLLFIAGVFVFWGYKFCVRVSGLETAVLQISRAIPYSAIPIGGAIFIIHLLISFPKFVKAEWDTAEKPEAGE